MTDAKDASVTSSASSEERSSPERLMVKEDVVEMVLGALLRGELGRNPATRLEGGRADACPRPRAASPFGPLGQLLDLVEHQRCTAMPVVRGQCSRVAPLGLDLAGAAEPRIVG